MSAESRKKNVKKLDIALIIVYLVISICGAIYFTIEGLSVHSGKKEVVISVKNETYMRVELPVDGQKEVVIDTDLGHNIIILDGNSVRVKYSDCKDQICVHQGEISAPNEMIVCLPNKLVVEIVGVEKQEVDQIAK